MAVFAGSYTGGGNITIDADCDCSATVLLSDDVDSLVNLIMFSVASNGSITNGLVYYAGSTIGTVSGPLGACACSGRRPEAPSITVIFMLCRSRWQIS